MSEARTTLGRVADRPELLTHSCGACGASWFGLERTHCAAPRCHRTFDDLRLYEAHRIADGCANPRHLGLVCNKGGIWVDPLNVSPAHPALKLLA